jgi:predicted nucleic acid-binding protein
MLRLTSLVLIDWIRSPRHRAVTSTITMTEILAKPDYTADPGTSDDIYGMLSNYPQLEWVVPTLEIARLAGEIRAQHRLRAVDSIQAATALLSDTTCLITNDANIRRVPDLKVLLLSKLTIGP